MERIVEPGKRVRSSSSRSRNQKTDEEIVSSIPQYSERGAAAIESRINGLNKEWKIERTHEVNAGILGLTGAILALTVNKRWAVLPAVVTSLPVEHATQVWCPPLPLFRRMGIKSRSESDREKYALKALRDDFKNIHNATQAWKAVNE